MRLHRAVEGDHKHNEKQKVKVRICMNNSYKKIVVVDLEATCWDNRADEKPNPPSGCRYSNEIIEIGAVCLDIENFSTLSAFSQFVKPKNNPILSDFCTELTTIVQSDVDDAPHFDKAIDNFILRHHMDDGETLWTSWGDYDQKQIIDDLAKWKITAPEWINHHVNMKEVVRDLLGLSKKRRPNLKKVFNTIGGERVGTQHRGIDDAQTYANILQKLFKIKGKEECMSAFTGNLKHIDSNDSNHSNSYS